MEERPSERPHEKRYHHGEERSPSRAKKSLKNEPSQCHYQNQETQTKKTGNGKINWSSTDREKVPSASDTLSAPYPANGHGHRSQLDPNWKLKQPGKVHSTLSKGGVKSGHAFKNSMDSRNDRPSDLRAHEGKKEPAAPLNGVVAINSGFLINGYPGKPATDNDGSGSESGYATPKKRKPQRGSVRGAEPATVTPEAVTHPKQEAEPPIPEQVEKAVSPSQLTAKAEATPGAARAKSVPGSTPGIPPLPPMGEPQRKNLDSKATAAFGKKYEDRPGKAKLNTSMAAKEDSWTLFKPPPVFPVDNSSAKIVPKISYASKVKENLNKASQAAGEASPAQLPGRPPQVPMSAMKTITSPSFTNGPLLGEGNGCPLSGSLFTAASTVPPATSLSGAENVAPPLEEGGSTAAAAPSPATGDPRKHGLFIYPHAPSSSNMQPPLPSGRQAAAPPAAPANQKVLVDIFQNQWGLSFINDPSAGPEGGTGSRWPAGKGVVAEVTFQGECPGDHAPLPKPHELDKRTSPQTLSSVLKACPPAVPGREGAAQAQPASPDGQKDAEAGSLGAIVFTSSKDPAVEALRASPTNPALALPREATCPKDMDRRSSWGSFDLKAAVNYHTKEMEYILNLQKQDPKRVVLYGETKDGPDQ
ncbi:nuclear fragile X mental retardation-interacting protein 2-like [Megalops cyprinoides]|uniref:nuclear fragile X mental retardation-interacting protein 2-like n=1 Tax=Megalops cyprinoides TaxID=118141 RepID=UPI0018649948|nr:nuclear fragile X mental retardation-interacting protein 2-like [Megalops cyprinoides]